MSAKATRSATTPIPIPTSAKSPRASSTSKSISPSGSSPASWACSRSTSVRPTTSTKNPTPTTKPRPSWRIQQDGLTIIGNKIDTDDWNEHPRKTTPEIIQSVLAQLQTMKTKPQFRGSIILMHDGGGDRSVTVAALGPLIDALRAHGYTIVPVSALMGKTTAQVMPPLTFWQRVRSIPDSIAFSALDIIGNFIVMVFFVGDILMSARLIIVGLFAIIDRLRSRTARPRPAFTRALRCSSPPTTKRR